MITMYEGHKLYKLAREVYIATGLHRVKLLGDTYVFNPTNKILRTIRLL